MEHFSRTFPLRSPAGSPPDPSHLNGPIKLIVAANWCPCGTPIERRFRFCRPCFNALPPQKYTTEANRIHTQARNRFAAYGKVRTLRPSRVRIS